MQEVRRERCVGSTEEKIAEDGKQGLWVITEEVGGWRVCTYVLHLSTRNQVSHPRVYSLAF